MVLAVVVLALLVAWFVVRRLNATPFEPDWTLDEGVTAADEARSEELLARYGREDVIELPQDVLLADGIRSFVERYAALEFDSYSTDYDRDTLLCGEDGLCRGFYRIGGDGGEISFYVRRSSDDETVYAFDMEGSERPEPYAGNVRRFVVMRYNDWKEDGEFPA